MEFALSEQQQMMQQSVEGVLKRACPLDRVRRFADNGEARAHDVWHQLTQLGIAGIVIPEQYGGMALGILEAALVAETLGRYVAPVPFVGSAVMAPLALMKAGTVRQRDHWLPHLASGILRSLSTGLQSVHGRSASPQDRAARTPRNRTVPATS